MCNTPDKLASPVCTAHIGYTSRKVCEPQTLGAATAFLKLRPCTASCIIPAKFSRVSVRPLASQVAGAAYHAQQVHTQSTKRCLGPGKCYPVIRDEHDHRAVPHDL